MAQRLQLCYCGIANSHGGMDEGKFKQYYALADTRCGGGGNDIRNAVERTRGKHAVPKSGTAFAGPTRPNTRSRADGAGRTDGNWKSGRADKCRGADACG